MSVSGSVSAQNDIPVLASHGRVAELHLLHEEVRRHVGELRQQVTDLSERLRKADKTATERDRLLEQIEPLKQRLAETTRQASTTKVDPDEHACLLKERDRIVEENESFLAEFDAEIANGEALRRERDDLCEEKARLEGQVANLEDENKGWLAEAETLHQQLEKARQDVRELESIAEDSMSEAAGVRKCLEETAQALEDERMRNEALQAQIVALTNAPPVAGSSPARGTAESTDTAQLIREIAKAVRRPAEPSPAILAGLRALRQDIEGLAQQQVHLEALVATRLSPEPRMESVSGQPISSAECDDSISPLSEHSATAPESVATPAPAETAAETEVEEQSAVEEFARVELAWLAGRNVGDRHERSHFQRIAEKLRRRNPQLRDDAALLQGLDTLRARLGDVFEYCLLEAALTEMHHLALNIPLLVMKMHTIKHRKNWRRH